MQKPMKMYFMGIKGVGMTSLALIAKQVGFEICGSDVEEQFITDAILEKNSITPLVGFSEENIKVFIGNTPDEEVIVITTSAHGGFENPEVSFARSKGIRVLTHGQAVGEFMKGEILGIKSPKGISIAGAHGKTTITGMLATCMSLLTMNPSYVIGTSEINPIGEPGHFGSGEYFIAEADEYVSEKTYDKIPKFLYQHPHIGVINNIDFDHPDFYKDIDEVKKAFASFAKNIKEGGRLFLNGDSQYASEISVSVRQNVTVTTFGNDTKNDYYIDLFHEKGMSSTFTLKSSEKVIGEFSLSVPGIHNALNSIPVILILLELGVALHTIQEVLPKFLGTKRRIEVVGSTKTQSLIIDDYAHHPQEIKTTLTSLKKAFPTKKILCIFQPHTISRTEALISDFAHAFFDADTVILLPVFASLREKGTSTKVDEQLFSELKKQKTMSIFLPGQSDVLEYVRQHQNSDTIILTMGAGDVYKISAKLKAQSAKL